MDIHVLTLFPEMFEPLSRSMLGRAQENGILHLDLINIRDYSTDKHQKADDTPFGGGAGMVLLAAPVFGAMRSLGPEDAVRRMRRIYLSPRGRSLDQALIRELADEPELVLLCGHYEGVDQRVLDYWDMEEVSIGDYILTGGELPAMVLIDAVSRFLPGVLASRASAEEESVYSGLLEADQYTKPRVFEGLAVPEVLFSGNHSEIALWQWEKALRLTRARRPDMFARWLDTPRTLTKREKRILAQILSEESEE